MTAARYQVRRASTTGALAIIDTETETIEREYAPGQETAALDHCDTLNDLDRRFNESDHSAAAFAASWRAAVNL